MSDATDFPWRRLDERTGLLSQWGSSINQWFGEEYYFERNVYCQ